MVDAVACGGAGVRGLLTGVLVLSACGAPASPPACVGGDERLQRYGTDCTCCHNEFGVAGSVSRGGPEVVSIVVTGSGGQSARMSPNAFGNFFRHLQLAPPLQPTVTGADGRAVTMSSPAPDGGCNRCHDGEALPRVHAP